MRRIAPALKDELIAAVTRYGVAEATARRLAVSSFMPIMLSGQEELRPQHLPLLNQSIVNHIIRVERIRQIPTIRIFAQQRCIQMENS